MTEFRGPAGREGALPAVLQRRLLDEACGIRSELAELERAPGPEPALRRVERLRALAGAMGFRRLEELTNEAGEALGSDGQARGSAALQAVVDEVGRVLGGLSPEGSAVALPGPFLAPIEARPLDSCAACEKAPVLFERFRVVRQLGAGGYGTVHHAVDLRTGEPVAVKVPHFGQDLADRLRFMREAYALAAVHDRHVVGLREVGFAEGRHFYVMELVAGPTLTEHVERSGLLKEAEARAALRGLLEALGAIHAMGLVHRDVKPSNVVLRDGAADGPVLVDFGLARLQVDAGLTAPDIFLGTPEFLAPETIQDDVRDHRSDLFAAGATARWALTGTTGHEGLRGLALLDSVVQGPPSLPSGVASPGLSRTIDALCARDPARRPQSAAEALARVDVA